MVFELSEFSYIISGKILGILWTEKSGNYPKWNLKNSGKGKKSGDCVLSKIILFIYFINI
jgi:hypothetical protein